MKKLITTILTTFLLSGVSFADEFIICEGTGIKINVLNREVPVKISIKFHVEDNSYMFVAQQSSGYYFIYIDRDKLKHFRKNLEKFLEWAKIANEKKVSVEKELPDSTIKTRVGWYYYKTWCVSSLTSKLKMKFNFTATTSGVPYLTITSANKVTSSHNRFMTFDMDAIFLTESQALVLLSGTSAESLKKAENKYLKEKKNENLFK